MNKVSLCVLLISVSFASAQSYSPPPIFEDFGPWRKEIADQKKPTLVFVGMEAREVDKMLVCQNQTFPGVQGPCIIVSLYYDGEMKQHAVLRAIATDSDIRKAAGLTVVLDRKVVQPSADPFSVSNQQRIVRPEGQGGGGRSTFHQGHNCPSCGASQYQISGRGPIVGTHLHVCPKCTTSWYH